MGCRKVDWKRILPSEEITAEMYDEGAELNSESLRPLQY